MKKNIFRTFLIAVCISGFVAIPADAEPPVQKKKKAKVTKQSKSKKSKKAGVRAPKKGRFSNSTVFDANSRSTTVVLKDSMLSTGVSYRHLIMGEARHSVHVLSVDRSNPANAIELLKGGDRCNGLECLNDLAARYDSNGNDRVLGAINAHFWSAYGNRPIGPTVINGEVVEMKPYKEWSSGFFDANQRLYIDRFQMRGSIRFTNRRAFSVSSVNYRTNENDVVVYNSYGGDVIPYVSSRDISKAMEELKNNRVETAGDSTEELIDMEQLREQLAQMRRTADQEFSFPKIQSLSTKPSNTFVKAWPAESAARS